MLPGILPSLFNRSGCIQMLWLVRLFACMHVHGVLSTTTTPLAYTTEGGQEEEGTNEQVNISQK